MTPHNQNDDENPRRDRRSHEDNPFIAFRRFADSQVSTLLNGLAALPEWLADYNSINLAREQCLFGKANPEECKKLQEVEAKIERMYDNEFNFSKGNFTHAAVRDNIDKYMELEASAREIRTRIVEAGRGTETRSDGASNQIDLIERVGNQKGQQWGWSWDWGFPKPFDTETGQQQDQPEGLTPRGRWHNHGTRRNSQSTEEDKWERFSTSYKPSYFDGRAGSPFDTHISSHLDASSRDPYSPLALENNRHLRDGFWRDAFEDLFRLERGLNMIPHHQLGRSKHLTYNDWSYRFTNQPFTRPFSHIGDICPVPGPISRGEQNEEPSYEYAHDHEDQHDDPPTPKPNQGKWTRETPETELEAYERLLGPSNTQSDAPTPSRPSILSTLTTTERTVAPDGTITTKVVLKRRFADGKEESTETVHTHRGDGQDQDPWKAFQEAELPVQVKQESPEKKRGWFWSH
ncbi:hypothetical protein B0J11DRAFT_426797 [Dendryphion nanum]|uniref:Uncharacterized protein n=1 Tax=Dendryphion nanum TaxID=256645 RepID=A0A9P9IZ69_9PLEO|nr:hypothetical protein B0J11DRAFT_426797 [Dendryphion nanum]